MIYIKNTRTEQEIWIPRNEVDINVIPTPKTYEEGYREGKTDGIEEGKEKQKDQLLNLYVTKNGVYVREDGYGVVTVEMEGGGGSDIVLQNNKRVIIEEGVTTITPDEGYDGMSQVQVSAVRYGINQYNQGYEQGKAEGGSCNLEDRFEHYAENGTYRITPSEGFDGISGVDVVINVPQEGGSCNLEDVILLQQTTDFDEYGWMYIYPNEGYNGMSRVALNGDRLKDTWYNEGYNAASVPLNLQDKWVTPSMADRDGNGFIVLYPDEGYDGLERAVINPQTIYDEGYNQGKAEGGGSGEGVFNILDFNLNPENEWYEIKNADEEGVSGWQQVIVRTETAYNAYKERGKEEVRNNLKTLVVNEVGAYDINETFIENSFVFNNAKMQLMFNNTTPWENIKIKFSTYTLTEEGEWLPQIDLLELSNGLRITYSGGGVRLEGSEQGNIAYRVYPNINELELTQNSFTVNGQTQYFDYNLFEGANNNVVLGPSTETIVSIEGNGVTYSINDFYNIQGSYTEMPLEYKKYDGEGWNRVEVDIDSNDYTEYQYTSFSVEDSGLGSQAVNYRLKDNCFYNNNEQKYVESIYLPSTDNGSNNVKSKDLVTTIIGFPFEEENSVYKIVIPENIERVIWDNVDLTQLQIMVFDGPTVEFTSQDSNYPSLNTIVMKRTPYNTLLNFAYCNIADNGVVYIPNGYSEYNKNKVLENLPKGWRLTELPNEIMRLIH